MDSYTHYVEYNSSVHIQNDQWVAVGSTAMTHTVMLVGLRYKNTINNGACNS